MWNTIKQCISLTFFTLCSIEYAEKCYPSYDENVTCYSASLYTTGAKEFTEDLQLKVYPLGFLNELEYPNDDSMSEVSGMRWIIDTGTFDTCFTKRYVKKLIKKNKNFDLFAPEFAILYDYGGGMEVGYQVNMFLKIGDLRTIAFPIVLGCHSVFYKRFKVGVIGLDLIQRLSTNYISGSVLTFFEEKADETNFLVKPNIKGNELYWPRVDNRNDMEFVIELYKEDFDRSGMVFSSAGINRDFWNYQQSYSQRVLNKGTRMKKAYIARMVSVLLGNVYEYKYIDPNEKKLLLLSRGFAGTEILDAIRRVAGGPVTTHKICQPKRVIIGIRHTFKKVSLWGNGDDDDDWDEDDCDNNDDDDDDDGDEEVE